MLASECCLYLLFGQNIARFQRIMAMAFLLRLILAVVASHGLLASAAADYDWQSPLMQAHPLTGKIFSTQSQQKIDAPQLLNALKQHDYVLIGEKHDNPDHHRLQLQLLDLLLSANNDQQVVFEMLDDSQHVALKSLDQHTPSKVMQQKLQWSKQRWAWESYGPLFTSVLANGAILRDGNINRNSINAVYKQGPSVLTPRERFASRAAIDADKQQQMLEHIFINHCQMMAKERLAPMVEIQKAKDASMAYALVDKDSGILITGAYHSRKDLGVPQHLQFLGKSKKAIAVLVLLEVEAHKTAFSDYPMASAQQADFIWFTPKWSDKDYCQAMKSSMQKPNQRRAS